MLASRGWRVAAVLLLATSTLGTARGDTVEVIGTGLGRSGTESLRTALSSLGFKTYHMSSNILGGHSGHWAALARRWGEGGDEGVRARDRLIDNVFGANGFTATTDFPACLLYKDLLRRNPAAKVILGVRDTPGAWARSIKATIGRVGALAQRPPLSMALALAPGGRYFAEMDAWMMAEVGMPLDDATGKVASPATLPTAVLEKVYEGWVARVKRDVPPGQLLLHNAKQGWPPICKFLGLEGDACPATPYPHSNAGMYLGTVFDALELLADAWPVSGLLLAALAAAAGWACWACCRRGGRKGADKRD